MKKNRVAIADDHKIVRNGLKRLLENLSSIELVYEAADGEEILDYVQKNSDLDLLILDLSMPKKTGIEVLEHMKEHKIDIPVVVLSMHEDFQYIKKCMDLNVYSYIFKDASDDEMLKSFSCGIKRENYLSDKVKRMLNLSQKIEDLNK